jgi:hypothetical protein
MNLTKRFRKALLDTAEVSSTIITIKDSSSKSLETFAKVNNPLTSFVIYFMRTIFPRKIDGNFFFYG